MTDGQTATPDTLTVDHLEQVGQAIGLRVYELVAIAEDRGAALTSHTAH